MVGRDTRACTNALQGHYSGGVTPERGEEKKAPLPYSDAAQKDGRLRLHMECDSPDLRKNGNLRPGKDPRRIFPLP